ALEHAPSDQLLEGARGRAQVRLVRGHVAQLAVEDHVRVRGQAEELGEREGLHDVVSPGALRGSASVNVVPSTGVEETDTAPPWARAMLSTMNRPRPMLRVWKPMARSPRLSGWNKSGTRSGGMASPRLCTS